MLGTINGFSLTYPERSGSGGGGGGSTYDWIREVQVLTESAGGVVFNLLQHPVSDGAITVWWQGLILFPDDYDYNPGLNTLTIPIAVTLPDDNPDEGTWSVFVQYPYAV